MTRILVTGASGLLGINFSLFALENGHEVVGTVNQHALREAPFTTMQVNLSRHGSIEKIIETVRPEIILHTAAMAIIDSCEKHPDLSKRINAEVPGDIARISKRLGIRLVHVSTDAVFDGVSGGYVEDDLPNPLSTYALHKLEGEQQVSSQYPEAVIARVNFFGWSLNGNRSLSEWFFNNLSQGKTVKGFTDVYFCPLLVNDLACLLLKMIQKPLRGVYHVLAPVSLSKYEFGCLIARQFNLNEKLIEPMSWKDGGLQAARSPNLILKVDKLCRDLGETPPSPEAGVAGFVDRWQNGYAGRVRSMASSG
ncbi:MAG: SDR family oxidoreductase [Anaerolineae bacterium]|nr:SDR family oxidoreductase [Anaerolineae bacterium]